MDIKSFKSILVVGMILVLFSPYAFAEVRTFHGESEYIMNDSEPIKKAQEIAFYQTIREIAEQAGVYIESSSKISNGKLKSDEIAATTTAVLKIKIKKYGKEYTQDGKLKILASVDAEMDTDNVEELLKELIEARKSSKNYEEVLKDYTKRKNQFDTVYGDYLNSFQKRIMQKIRDGCKLQNEDKLDEALKLYNEAIVETSKENAELSLVYVKRGHIYNLQRQSNLALSDFEKAIALNNDLVGIHYAKALLLESRDNKSEAVKEYRAFLKDADIVYYDTEITDSLNRIVELEYGEVN